MITFSLVHARSVFGCRASVLAIFESLYLTATRFGCGEICDDCFIANFPQSVPVKELWKSVENWLSYRYELGVPLFCNTEYSRPTSCAWTILNVSLYRHSAACVWDFPVGIFLNYFTTIIWWIKGAYDRLFGSWRTQDRAVSKWDGVGQYGIAALPWLSAETYRHFVREIVTT